MEKYLKYYYDVDINDLKLEDSKYYFNDSKNTYVFEKCFNGEIIKYYNDLYRELYQYDFFAVIVSNRMGQLITTIEGNLYILLKYKNIYDFNVSLHDIKPNFYVSNIDIIDHSQWIKLWEQKIDYFEDWFQSKKEKYKNIYALFYYYIGMAENALLYVKEAFKETNCMICDKLTIQHYRLNIDTNLYEYYDPINLVVDHSSRDVSEYIKSQINNDIFNVNEFKEYLDYYKFSNHWLRMLYARLYFPSFFFDKMELIINELEDINAIMVLEKEINNYLHNISDISKMLFEKYNIPIINWSIKKT